MNDRPKVRLWTRLSGGTGDTYAVDSSDYQHAVLESVREHLIWLLNTRQGDALACSGYGLPDISGIVAGLPKSERSFCAAVEKTILEHEPRIFWVRVSLDERSTPGGTKAHFVIELTLKSGSFEKRRLSGNVDIDTVFTLS